MNDLRFNPPPIGQNSAEVGLTAETPKKSGGFRRNRRFSLTCDFPPRVAFTPIRLVLEFWVVGQTFTSQQFKKCAMRDRLALFVNLGSARRVVGETKSQPRTFARYFL